MTGSKTLLLMVRKGAAVNAAAFFCKRAGLVYKGRNGKIVEKSRMTRNNAVI